MLRRFLMVPLAILLLGAGPDPVSTETKTVTVTEKEIAKLQGTWEGVSAEVFGWKKGNAEDAVLIIDHDSFTLKRGNKVMLQGPVTVDSSKKLKTMDVVVKKSHDAREKGKVALCVYELDKDTLQWCLAEPLGYDLAKGQYAHRPSALTPSNYCQVLFTFKKAKP